MLVAGASIITRKTENFLHRQCAIFEMFVFNLFIGSLFPWRNYQLTFGYYLVDRNLRSNFFQKQFCFLRNNFGGIPGMRKQ